MNSHFYHNKTKNGIMFIRFLNSIFYNFSTWDKINLILWKAAKAGSDKICCNFYDIC